VCYFVHNGQWRCGSAGLRYLATGLIIIAVITAAGGQKTLR
jgi:hypothetical protein